MHRRNLLFKPECWFGHLSPREDISSRLTQVYCWSHFDTTMIFHISFNQKLWLWLHIADQNKLVTEELVKERKGSPPTECSCKESCSSNKEVRIEHARCIMPYCWLFLLFLRSPSPLFSTWAREESHRLALAPLNSSQWISGAAAHWRSYRDILPWCWPARRGHFTLYTHNRVIKPNARNHPQ